MGDGVSYYAGSTRKVVTQNENLSFCSCCVKGGELNRLTWTLSVCGNACHIEAQRSNAYFPSLSAENGVVCIVQLTEPLRLD